MSKKQKKQIKKTLKEILACALFGIAWGLFFAIGF